jgi:hypothetical protein
MGVLITPSGARIPLPRRSYYTQKYVNRLNRLRKEGRRRGKLLVHKTQVDLACLIVKELDLPDNIGSSELFVIGIRFSRRPDGSSG